MINNASSWFLLHTYKDTALRYLFRSDLDWIR